MAAGADVIKFPGRLARELPPTARERAQERVYLEAIARITRHYDREIRRLQRQLKKAKA